jgi:hypothetical protein
MIYFDSGMAKSTNTVVYFDWKTVIYIYVCGKCRTQYMLPMEKSVTFIDASYQASVHWVKGFQSKRLKCEKFTDGRRIK